jgi:predicted phage-related endonuclease
LRCVRGFPYTPLTNETTKEGENKMSKSVVTTQTVVETSTKEVELATDLENVLREFNETKEAMKVLEGRKKELETAIREAMGDSEVGTINGVQRVKIATRTRSDINKDDLKEVYPEAYSLCLKETTYTVVTAVS